MENRLMLARRGEMVDKMDQGWGGWGGQSKIQTSEIEVIHGNVMYIMGFPGGSSGKELPAKTEDIKRRVLDPWVGKIPWKRAWQPTQVFLPGESALTYSFPNFALFHVQF